MKLKYFLLILAPVIVLGSEAASKTGTDIIPRTLNFLIFASILYYLVADAAKNFYFDRKNSIASKLDSIQMKLKESNSKKENALQKVEEAKVSARILVDTAKKEAVILGEKIAMEAEQEIENLQKTLHDKVSIEERKMQRHVVNEVLDDLFKEGSIALDHNEMVKIINKKVA